MKLTGGRGVDTAIEAVGIPATFELCAADRRARRHHRQHRRARHEGGLCIWSSLWDRNITITTRLVDTVSTPMLLKIAAGAQDRPEAADHPPLQARPASSMPTRPSAQAANTRALKVIIEA